MSTKAADLPQAVTDQSRPTVFDSARAAWSAAIRSATLAASGTEWASSPTASRYAYYQMSEKALEANRQIERVKSLASLCKSGTRSDQDCVVSIGTSVALIGSLICGPVPIPVASSGESGCTSLFFGDLNFYGDLEVRGKFIDYYLKGKSKGADIEVFDSEEVKNGQVPPKLLFHLYTHYAR